MSTTLATLQNLRTFTFDNHPTDLEEGQLAFNMAEQNIDLSKNDANIYMYVGNGSNDRLDEDGTELITGGTDGKGWIRYRLRNFGTGGGDIYGNVTIIDGKLKVTKDAATAEFVLPLQTVTPVSGTEVGSLRWNTTLSQLQVWNGTTWDSSNLVFVGSSAPTPASQGDLWYDTNNSSGNSSPTLKVYDSTWKSVGRVTLGTTDVEVGGSAVTTISGLSSLSATSLTGTLQTASQTNITEIGTITTGTWNATAIGVAYGGTGLTASPANGQVPIGNGTGYTLATITGGTALTTTNGAGSITIDLDNTAVSPGSYGSSTSIPTFTVDQQGRLTAAGSNTISTTLNISGDGGTGSVDLLTQTLTVSGGTGLTSVASAQTITVDLDNTAVTPAAYGAADTVSTFTVDQQGRLTAAADVTISIVHTQVSDFDAGVQSNRLDQMAAPTSDVGFNNVKITSLSDPTNAQDAATKSYVDASVVVPGGSDTQIQYNSSGSFAGSGNLTFDGTTVGTTGLSVTGTSSFRAAALQDGIKLLGRAGGTADYDVTLTPTTLTGDRTLTLPDSSGTVALTSNKLSAFAATTSAELAGVISDETGTGALVFASSPTLTTPTLGVASATSINKVAITAPASGSTLTIANGKTLTVSNTLTFTGTDSSLVELGAGGTVAYTSAKLSAFSSTTSAELAGVISDETGTGSLVFSTSPTLVTPILGTPASGNLSNCTNLPAGQLSGTIPSAVLGNSTLYVGTTAVALNRASGVLSLTGMGNFSLAADSTYDLGSNAVRWANIYADNVYSGDLHLKNDRGDYTLVEEEDALTIRNNKTGKVYNIVMTEREV